MLRSRRYFAHLSSVAALTTLAPGWVNARSESLQLEFTKRIGAIEHAVGGRLGATLIDPGQGRTLGYRADERFPMCSTFKLLAAAAVLAKVDQGQESLERRVAVKGRQIVPHSPVTSPRTGSTMAVGELCEAALTRSDNTAGNLLLDGLGGPAGLTRFARSIGDKASRLDRMEVELNEARPGDIRDTTSPAAMARSIQSLCLGTILSEGARTRLLGWLGNSQTSDQRFRAGLPEGWKSADKTGAGEHGTTNDVGLLWPPRPAGTAERSESRPLVLTVYLTQSQATIEARNGAIAEVVRAVTSL